MAGGAGLFPQQGGMGHSELQLLLETGVAREAERRLGGHQINRGTGVT